MRSGSLRERGKGRWQYRASFGTHPDGRPRTRSVTFNAANKTAADRKARQIRAAWDGEDEADEAKKGTVAALVTEWSEWARTKDRSHSPTTTYRYRPILARIVKDLGAIKVANLNARDLDRWYATLKQPVKGSRPLTGNTILQYHRVLHGILHQGYKWGMVNENVADRSTPPELEKHDQLERMPTLAALEVMMGGANRTVRMAVLLAATTGCRRGELVGLRWSDLGADGVLTVQRSLAKVPGQPLVVKGLKAKTVPVKRVPLNPAIIPELAQFRAEAEQWAESVGVTLVEGGPILAHLRADPTGATPFAPDWLSQEWERLCQRSGVAPFKLHGTRHLLISNLHASGAASASIQNRVGHASIATTEAHYTHALPAAVRELAATVDDVYAPLFAVPRRA